MQDKTERDFIVRDGSDSIAALAGYFGTRRRGIGVAFGAARYAKASDNEALD